MWLSSLVRERVRARWRGGRAGSSSGRTASAWRQLLDACMLGTCQHAAAERATTRQQVDPRDRVAVARRRPSSSASSRSSRSSARSVSTIIRLVSIGSIEIVARDDDPGEAHPADRRPEQLGLPVGTDVDGRAVGEQQRERSNVRPKVPSTWWFLPWMSLAMAPPTVTKRVPGDDRHEQATRDAGAQQVVDAHATGGGHRCRLGVDRRSSPGRARRRGGWPGRRRSARCRRSCARGRGRSRPRPAGCGRGRRGRFGRRSGGARRCRPMRGVQPHPVNSSRGDQNSAVQYGHSGTGRPSRRSTLPAPDRQEQFDGDVAGEPSELGELGGGIAQPGPTTGTARSARYSASERARPTYRKRRPNTSSRMIAAVTPTDEKASWTSIVPPRRHTSPPVTEVGPRRAHSGGRRRRRARRSGRATAPWAAAETGGDVTDPVAHTGSDEVALEGVAVGRRLGGEPVELAGTPVVAGMGVDGDDRDPFRRVGGEDDRRSPRKLPISTISPSAGHAAAAAASTRSLLGGEPSFDADGPDVARATCSSSNTRPGRT